MGINIPSLAGIKGFFRFRSSRPSDGDEATHDKTGDPAASEEYHDASSTAISPQASIKTEPKDHPPPYSAPAVSDPPRHGVPTQRQPNSSARGSRAWQQSGTTVSRLPLSGPSTGHTYLGDCQHHIISALDPIAQTPLPRCQLLTSRVYNIQPGEVERPVTAAYNWTAGWDWVLTLEFGDPKNDQWSAWGCIYFNETSIVQPQGNPWKGAQQLNAGLIRVHKDYVFKYSREWRFCGPADDPGWAGNIRIAHNDYSTILGIDDPWAFPTPGSIFK
ncbi:hypothetical protein IMZ48_22910 [Candidatus Bathyarchaeota archaeon]|nr:hypothetical protein [Candidatus Bathyarchaeota archaeon]